jgi:hypothetical protein
MGARHPGCRRAALAALLLLWLPGAGSAADVRIEGESLVETTHASDGRVMRQDMAGFGSGWSGAAQLFWRAPGEGARLELPAAVPTADRYQVRIAYTRAPDYGRIRVTLDGQSLGELDGFADRVVPAASDLGPPIEVSAGAHEIVLTVVGRSARATGFFVGVDRVDFVRAPAPAAPPAPSPAPAETPAPPEPAAAPAPPAATEPPLPPWTSRDVIDERIDVAAQYALMRMFKGDPTEQVDASNILSAVKSGALGGIYQEDQRAPALRAQSLGTWWGTILPKPAGGVRVDGICMLPPPEKPPIIVMRRKAEKNPAAYDRSLQAAWWMCGLPPSPLRPYLTSPGTPAPPDKAGRCAAPKPTAHLSVLVMRRDKFVANADVLIMGKSVHLRTATSDDGYVTLEMEPGFYAVTATDPAAPEAASSQSVEVLPRCETWAAFDMAEARVSDPCGLARDRAQHECLTAEILNAYQTCNERTDEAKRSCSAGDEECQIQARVFDRSCIAPIKREQAICHDRIKAELGCASP